MALSDGIFAVAITLLVLDLRLPDVVIPNDQALQRRLFQLVREHDRVIEYTNLLFLVTVCFIPAPTSVLGRYNDFPTAVAVYAASQALTGAMLTFMWWYGVLRLARHPGEQRRVALYFTLRSLVTTCVFVLFIPVAVISAAAGRLSWLAIPVAYVVIGRLLHARVPRNLRPSI